MYQVQAPVRCNHGINITFKPGFMLPLPCNSVLPRNKRFFPLHGMTGWYDQQNKCSDWVTVQGVKFKLLGLGMWDENPEPPGQVYTHY